MDRGANRTPEMASLAGLSSFRRPAIIGTPARADPESHRATRRHGGLSRSRALRRSSSGGDRQTQKRNGGGRATEARAAPSEEAKVKKMQVEIERERESKRRGTLPWSYPAASRSALKTELPGEAFMDRARQDKLGASYLQSPAPRKTRMSRTVVARVIGPKFDLRPSINVDLHGRTNSLAENGSSTRDLSPKD